MKAAALALAPPRMETSFVLTGAQIRAARALLRWSGKDLADKSGVSYPAIQRAEATDQIPNMQVRNLLAIKAALMAGGVDFIEPGQSSTGGQGVRLKE